MSVGPSQFGILDRMRRLFNEGKRTSGPVSPRLAAGKAQDIDNASLLFSHHGVNNIEFKGRIGNLKKANRSLISGRLHFLNLKAIRDRAGEKWPRIALTVHGITQSILSQYMSDDDFFTIVGDHTYMTVFPSLNEEEAKAVCVKIAQEVMGRLMGNSPDFAQIDLRVAVARVDGGMSFETVDLFDAMDKTLDAAGDLRIEPSMLDRPAQHAIPPLSCDLAALVDIQGPNWQFIGHAKKVDKPQLDPRVGTFGFDDLWRASRAQADGQPQGADETMDLSAMFNLASGSPAAPARSPIKAAQLQGADNNRYSNYTVGPHVAADGGHGERRVIGLQATTGNDLDVTNTQSAPRHFNGDGKLTIRYVPVWQVKNSVISGYHSSSHFQADDLTLTGESLIPLDAPASLVAAYDAYILKHVLDGVIFGEQAKKPCIVIIPAHASTVRRIESGSQYLGLCNTIPQESRKFMVWEIIHRTTDTPSPTSCEAMKRFCRAIVFRLDENWSDFSILAGTEIHGVGFDCFGSRSTEDQLIAAMNRFTERAEPSGIWTFVSGVGSKSLATAAVCAGVDYLYGDAIVAPTDAPQGIHQFALEDIF